MAKALAQAEAPVKDAGADASPTWPFRFTLAKPVEVFGTEIRELVLREPDSETLLKFGVFDDEITGTQLLDLIAQLSGHSPTDIRKLPGLDMLKLSKKLCQLFLLAAK